MKPLIVGESNPYSRDPSDALLPYPAGSAGSRLAHLILDMTDQDYLATFDRVNLCGARWSMREARSGAEQVRSQKRRFVVLLGAKVCQAFDARFAPFKHWSDATTTFVVLPHPSGLSRAWHQPGAITDARAALRRAGIYYPTRGPVAENTTTAGEACGPFNPSRALDATKNYGRGTGKGGAR